MPERSYLFIYNNLRLSDQTYLLNTSQEFQLNEVSIGLSQRVNYKEKFVLNGMGLSLGLTLENFDIGMQYFFPLKKRNLNFATSVFEFYMIFEFTPFRRNGRGSLKRLQIDNY